MKNIDIPKPCSEDWNEMNPTEKGAFCQKCALEVYDFTNKSENEIRDILALNIGSRVCGRIEPKQLDTLNDDFSAWRMTNKRSYQRAWVFTLFVVFGMTLFSCEEDEIPALKKIQKTTQVILKDQEKTENVGVGEKMESVHDMTTGQFRYVGEPIEPEVPEMVEMLGELEYVEKDVNHPIETGMDNECTVKRITVTQGAMISTAHYEESLIKRTRSTSNEVEEMSGLVYPNPASNQTTLKVNMPSKGKAQIELFGLNGQKIRTIHSGRIKKGETEYSIDLTDLETGAYFCVIYSNGNKKTVKFSKI